MLEESETEEIHDALYEQLGVKLKENKPEFSYKHFLVNGSCDDAVTIKEANSFIRDGTTGLKLWPASLSLAEYIMNNKTTFDGKSILELGSGATGFVGMVLLKTCRPEKIYLSDCHDSVLHNLTENVDLNLGKCEAEVMEKSFLARKRVKLPDGPEFGILSLPWEDVDKHESELMSVVKPDVLLAADVVYDDSIFDALIKCLKNIFDLAGPSLMFYLSQTVRNLETFEKFCDLLLAKNFQIIDETVKYSGFEHWENPTDIKILKISKNL